MTITPFHPCGMHHTKTFSSLRTLIITALIAICQLHSSDALAGDLLDRSVRLDIPENTSLEDALIEWGTKAGMTVMINTPTVSQRLTHGVSGSLKARNALALILRDSGLWYTEDGGRIRIVVKSALVHSTLRDDTLGSRLSDPSGSASNASETASDSLEDERYKTSEHKEVPVVYVTAQKVEERLQDVPVPVSVLDAQNLIDTGQVRLSDYYSSIPSLNWFPVETGGSNFVIRGLNSTAGNTTTAVLVDGIPFGSTVGGSSAAPPDFDPSDLERIEVLRGPQGTLFGASTIGGIINFVTVSPSTDHFSGRVESDLGEVQGGSGPDYAVRAAANLPISDSIAIRASGFFRRDAGYIDNVQTGQAGINWANNAGGRVAGLWKLSESASIQLAAFLQNSNLHGESQVFIAPGFGDLQQSYLRGTGWAHQSTQDYTATIKARVGTFDVTSLTSYNVNLLTNSNDATGALGPLIPGFGPSPGSNLMTFRKGNNFSEEFRLAAKLTPWLDILLGGFFTHQSIPTSQINEAADQTTGAYLGSAGSFVWLNKYQESAGFADITVHFTDKFDIQLGGREAFNKQYFQETDSGPLIPVLEGVASPAVYAAEYTNQSVFTYLITPRFRLSDHFMTYARVASGYRPGGPNTNDFGVLAPAVPAAFGADSSKNYEVGMKGDVFSNRLSFDVSVYRIDWFNLQTAVLAPCQCLTATGNGGDARSQGVELSLEMHPISGMTLSTWSSWNDGKFTSDNPVIGIQAGHPLIGQTKYSGSASLEQRVAIRDNFSGFIGGDVSYMGARSPLIGAAGYPAYAKTNVRVGVDVDSWRLSLFADNVANRRGLLTGGPGQLEPRAYTIVKPRTVGLSVSKTFK